MYYEGEVQSLFIQLVLLGYSPVAGDGLAEGFSEKYNKTTFIKTAT